MRPEFLENSMTMPWRSQSQKKHIPYITENIGNSVSLVARGQPQPVEKPPLFHLLEASFCDGRVLRAVAARWTPERTLGGPPQRWPALLWCLGVWRC